jgi:hypothetical protein
MQFSRLPDDWNPSPELMIWAQIKRPDLTLPAIEDEVENFKEFWFNARGKHAEKKDWDRAFQTWIRRAANRRQYSSPYKSLNQPGGDVVL